MVIKVIEQLFSICKIADISEVNFSDEFCFVSRTDEELSLVCGSKYVPETAAECDNGWRAFRIQGVLDFSLIGILSEICKLLADEKIGIFAVSTYNTDYILTKKENFERALLALASAGYDVVR